MRHFRQERPYNQQPYPLQQRNRMPYFHHQPQQPSAGQHPIKDLAVRGMSGLNKTLNNVQNIVNVVERTAPVIEKYGPLMKNIPAMYKMLKAIQTENPPEERDYKSDAKPSKEMGQTKAITDQSIETKEQTGVSTPKLFYE